MPELASTLAPILAPTLAPVLSVEQKRAANKEIKNLLNRFIVRHLQIQKENRRNKFLRDAAAEAVITVIKLPIYGMMVGAIKGLNEGLKYRVAHSEDRTSEINNQIVLADSIGVLGLVLIAAFPIFAVKIGRKVAVSVGLAAITAVTVKTVYRAARIEEMLIIGNIIGNGYKLSSDRIHVLAKVVGAGLVIGGRKAIVGAVGAFAGRATAVVTFVGGLAGAAYGLVELRKP